MKIALAQMSMTADIAENLKKALRTAMRQQAATCCSSRKSSSRRFSRSMKRKMWTPTPWARTRRLSACWRRRPVSIRTCVLMGAELVIVPTANTKAEPLEMFEWEMRVQAMQNQVFIAMCNRVGTEGDMDFAGESLVIHPSGAVLKKVDDTEQLLTCDIDLAEASSLRKKIPYLATRRPECYL